MEWLPYLLIPPITAFVGWFTNFLGIKMMFYPLRWVGIGQFLGWQGIIPRLRIRLIRNLVNMSVVKICTPADVFEALEEADTVSTLVEFLDPYVDEWVDDIIAEHDIPAWDLALPPVRALVYQRVRKQLPDIAKAILADFSDRADRLVDIAALAEERVADDPGLLVELFLRCTGDELKFVVRSGLYFGLPLGILQALCWFLYPAAWVLPFFGVIAGAGTNWIALKLIAHPAEPKKIGPWIAHGLFLKRQAAVSEVFGDVFVTNFMNARSLFDHVWNGPKSAEVHRIVNRHIRSALDANWIAKTLASMAVQRGKMDEMRKFSADYAAEQVAESLEDAGLAAEVTAPVRRLISQRMAALGPKEFQQLLLPAFEEDQLLVVLLGGVLGGLAGFAQFVWIFGGAIAGA